MSFLNLFVIIPVVMLLCLWLARNDKQVRIVMAVGSTALLGLAIYLVFAFLAARETQSAEQVPFLFGEAIPWFEPLNIYYRTGVDGIAVVMILLSAIIVFTGTFASWQLHPLQKEYFLWFTLLSTGVFGFSSLRTSSRCSCSMRSHLSRCTCLSASGVPARRSIQP